MLEVKGKLDEISPATLRKKPFSITADKVTINKLKLEPILIKMRMNGVYVVVPAKCVHIDYSCDALKGDGNGLALNKCDFLRVTLGRRDRDIIAYCSGQCYDGQYIHDKVPMKVKQFLNLPATHTIIWDYNHQIELAQDVVNDNNIFEVTFIAINQFLMLPLQHGSVESVKVIYIFLFYLFFFIFNKNININS